MARSLIPLNGLPGLARVGIPLALAFCALPLISGCPQDYAFTAWIDPTLGAADRLITLSPPVLDLGNVPPAGVGQGHVNVRNDGARILYLDDVSILGTGALSAAPPLQRRLEPGESTLIPITYRPVGFERVTATLVVTSSDPVLPRVSSGIAARSEPPKIRLTPPAFDFGLEFTGCPLTHDMIVANDGEGILKVEGLGLGEGSGEFRVAFDPPTTLPLVLGPGEAHGIQVFYRPEDTGEDATAVEVASNDPALPVAEAPMFGAGQVEGHITDRFDQVGNNTTDILFVVDNSFSMAEEQDTLACNFQSFLNIVDTLGIDYHIGVITTDSPVLQGEEKVITPESTAPLDRFTENVKVGLSGFTQEQGFAMATEALTYPLVDSQNEGFFRPSAGLRVIFVSDEDDQSPFGVEEYIDALAQLSNVPQALIVSAIVGNAGEGCGGDVDRQSSKAAPVQSVGADACPTQECGRALPGTRYLQAVEETGGVFASICSCNFIDAMEAIAFETVHLVDTFFLTQTPRPETIVVTVGGSVTEAWTYLPEENAVYFPEALAVPPNGARVAVDYDLRAFCED